MPIIKSIVTRPGTPGAPGDLTEATADTLYAPIAAIPTGGTDGQVLTKTSGTDYDTAWETPSVSGGASAPVNVRNEGALGTGAATAMSTLYGTLGAAQADYPATESLTDTIDWAVVQSVLDTITDGGAVYLPRGNYQFNKTLTVQPYTKLLGDGWWATYLQWTTDLGTGEFAITTATRASTADSPYVTVRDLQVLGFNLGAAIGTAPAAMSGIAVNDRWVLENVVVQGFYAGLDIHQDHAFFRNVKASNNYYGVYFSDGSTTFGDHYFASCDFDSTRHSGIAVHPNNFIGSSVFSEVHLGRQPYGLYREDGSSTRPFLFDNHFTGLTFEYMGNGWIHDAVGTLTDTDGRFTGNRFEQWSGAWGGTSAGVAVANAYTLPSTTPGSAIRTQGTIDNVWSSRAYGPVPGADAWLTCRFAQGNEFAFPDGSISTFGTGGKPLVVQTAPGVNSYSNKITEGSKSGRLWIVASGKTVTANRLVQSGQNGGLYPMSDGDYRPPLGVAALSGAAATTVPVWERGVVLLSLENSAGAGGVMVSVGVTDKSQGYAESWGITTTTRAVIGVAMQDGTGEKLVDLRHVPQTS